MVKYCFLFIVLMIKSGLAQEKYKTAEGFYDLSSFETASGIYLLADQTFFYYSSFGNVDLKLYGVYSISDQNLLSLKLDDELTEEFKVYGLSNPIETDSILLYYAQPFAAEAEKLFVYVSKKKQVFPAFMGAEEVTSAISGSSKEQKIIVGYEDPKIAGGFDPKKTVEFAIADGVNEIKIYHNYYAEMATAIAQWKFNAEKGTLKLKDASENKAAAKKELDEATINEVNDFIKAKRSKTTITKDGKTYQKL